MGERGLFRGYALNAIDAKGRVALPAAFRKTIERNSEEPFVVIGTHEAAACLTGYDRNHSAVLLDELTTQRTEAKADGTNFDRHGAARRAFGMVDDAGFDASGRFIMPAFFRAKAQLTDWVLFLAAGQVFEMWNPQTCLAADAVDGDTKDLVRFLLSERGLAA